MEQQDSNEKEHAATGRRLAELRRKGTVLRSRDLSGGLVFITVVVILLFQSTNFALQMQKNYIESFTGIQKLMLDPNFLGHFLAKIVFDNFILLIPLFLGALIIIFLTPFLFGGWNFTLEVLQINLEKLNPINNLARLFSPKQAMLEIGRAILKCGIIISCLIYFLLTQKDAIKLLIDMPLDQGMITSFAILKSFIILLSLATIFLMAVDVGYQYWLYGKQSKMSTQEIKDEAKDTDGSPDTKRKIRSKQYALFKQRLAISVPRANVIVTNPTHYAVALKYDDKKDRAPKVVAKGKDYLAQQIRQIAIANGIPMYEAPPLARAIYFTTKLNHEVHPELYMAVAIVLSYVHQLKNYQMGKGKAPNFVSDFELPKEFIYQD